MPTAYKLFFYLQRPARLRLNEKVFRGVERGRIAYAYTYTYSSPYPSPTSLRDPGPRSGDFV